MLLKLDNDFWIHDHEIFRIFRCEECDSLVVEAEDPETFNNGTGEYHVDEWVWDQNFATHIKADPGYYLIQFGSELKRPVLFWTIYRGGVIEPEAFGTAEFDTVAPHAVLAPDGTVTEHACGKVYLNREAWELARANWEKEHEEFLLARQAKIDASDKADAQKEENHKPEAAPEPSKEGHVIPFNLRRKKTTTVPPL
jgi:hypothetical protein